MSIFGPLFTGTDLEEAAVGTIRRWLPTYLAEMERRAGLDVKTIARPRFYGAASTTERFAEEQMPWVLVGSPGTEGEPIREDQAYASWFQVSVEVRLATSTEQNSRRVAQMYAAAIRALIIHRPSLGQVADASVWRGEEWYGAPPTTRRGRSLGGAIVHFICKVSHLVEEFAGPIGEPLEDESEEWPDNVVAEEVTVEVIGE